jgi:hypothetical protein
MVVAVQTSVRTALVWHGRLFPIGLTLISEQAFMVNVQQPVATSNLNASLGTGRKGSVTAKQCSSLTT